MSLFFISPPNTPAPTDAWRVRVEVDPTDWEGSTQGERLQFIKELYKRYVDGNGNSPYDLVEIVAGGRVVRAYELYDPPRRTGPLGGDCNQPQYRRGKADEVA